VGSLSCSIWSRSGHGRPYPCTKCGQLCGQPVGFPGVGRAQPRCPQVPCCVPNRLYLLSTSATRWANCSDGGRSTPSTALTSTTAFISSGTASLSNPGDSWFRLGRAKVEPQLRPGHATDGGRADSPTPGIARVLFGRTVGRPVPNRDQPERGLGDFWFGPPTSPSTTARPHQPSQTLSA